MSALSRGDRDQTSGPGRSKPPSTHRPGPATQQAATPARGAPPVSTTAAAAPALSRRDLALLRATAAGRCELLCGCAPDLLVDGR